MGVNDQREVIDFYGFYTYDWTESFGQFADHHFLLEREYISDGCSTSDSSEIQGNICLAASGATSTVTAYRVSLYKMHEDNTSTELASTGWVTVNDTLGWDASLSIGDEMVYHFYIDVWQQKQITDKERFYLQIEVNCDQHCHLWHSNDSTWKDVWVAIPFRL